MQANSCLRQIHLQKFVVLINVVAAASVYCKSNSNRNVKIPKQGLIICFSQMYYRLESNCEANTGAENGRCCLGKKLSLFNRT